MKKSDKKQLQSNWAFVVVGTILGFFVSVLASGVFTIIAEKQYDRAVIQTTAVSFVVSFLLVSLFSHFIDNIGQTNKMSGREIFKDYLKTVFRLKK